MSTATDKALSAAMGKQLQDAITTLNTKTSLITTTAGNATLYKQGNIVVSNFFFENLSSWPVSSWVTLGTVADKSFYPEIDKHFAVVGSTTGNNDIACRARVTTAGLLQVYTDANKFVQFRGGFSYVKT